MEQELLEQSNIELTILPLLSICSLTSDYQKPPNNKPEKLGYSLILAAKELPEIKSPQLLYFLNDCQKNFEQEAHILLDNGLSHVEVQDLFNKYKRYLTDCYFLKPEYYNLKPEGDISNFESWLFDESLSFDNTNTNIIDSLSTQLDTSNMNNSGSFQMSDFDFESGSIAMTSCFLGDVSSIEFDRPQLYSVSDTLYPNIQFLNHNQSSLISGNNNFNQNQNSSFDTFTLEDGENVLSSRRRRLTRENRAILESLFSITNFPNAAERKLIADRCNMTPSQVRIWFTNKRARSKGKVEGLN